MRNFYYKITFLLIFSTFTFRSDAQKLDSLLSKKYFNIVDSCLVFSNPQLAIDNVKDSIANFVEVKTRPVVKYFAKKTAPQKAALLSLVLPGSGQLYNRKYWKIPLVIGAAAGLGYVINFNYTFYNRYQTDYLHSLRNEPLQYYQNIFPAPSTASLKAARDGTRKNLELNYIGAFLIYVFTAVDAYVDAHLKTFTVDDDIGWLNIQPATFSDGYGNSNFGLKFSLNNYKKQKNVTLP